MLLAMLQHGVLVEPSRPVSKSREEPWNEDDDDSWQQRSDVLHEPAAFAQGSWRLSLVNTGLPGPTVIVSTGTGRLKVTGSGRYVHYIRSGQAGYMLSCIAECSKPRFDTPVRIVLRWPAAGACSS
jgi:hypothetical protein